MCHLLGDAPGESQKLSYGLLKAAAHQRTENLVIEAGVDTEDVVKAELPAELILILEQTYGSKAKTEHSRQV